MIIVRLSGGLGNQLFQFAAGSALAHRRKTKLLLDISGFDNASPDTTKRVYELGAFKIRAAPAGSGQIRKLAAPRGLRRLLNKVTPYYRNSVYREPFFHFDPNFLRAASDTLLSGYWQSEKYFSDVAPAIRNELQVTAPISPTTRSLYRQIGAVNAVSIHIRRGDYVSSKKTHLVHGTCSLEYYRQALALLKEKIGEAELFIFSDDIAWTKANLVSDLPTHFVDHNDAAHAYEDLFLMSSCRHHIIANSSFSWWGAWLNGYSDKIVVAPRKWFSHSGADTKDLLPEGWIKV